MRASEPKHIPSVSVIIPARNADATLPEVLDSVLSQDYGGPIEVIVADGSDTMATANMLWRRYPSVRAVSNPEQITPAGLNCALRVATGEIIVRCDSHSVLPQGYIKRVVATLIRTGAANVGGLQRPVGKSFVGRAVAMATTSFLGTGGARYRMGGPEGPTDTVYLGAWPRQKLEAVGGFNIDAFINEDFELNYRLRQRGEIVWFDPKLEVAYQPRGNLVDLFHQYFFYGHQKAVVLKIHPSSLRLRQLAAPLLVLGLVISDVLILADTVWSSVLPSIYFATIILGGLIRGLRHFDFAAVLVPLVLATIHLGWGIGFLFSICKKKSQQK